MSLRAWIAGVGAALRTPWWLEGPRLLELTRRGERSHAERPFDPASATAAHLALRVLARVPGGRWRATCLFRSAAEVMLRRAGGEDAALQLGVRREGEGVGAHAWVESGGIPVGRDAAHASRYVAFRDECPVTRRLTTDGAFTLAAPPGLLDDWLPATAAPAAPGEAHVEVERRSSATPAGAGAPTLTLLDVGAWVDAGRATLCSADGRLDGKLDLEGRRGVLGIVPGAGAEPLLTVATALLLGRIGRALVHAAAVVAPDGRAWLLLGDSHSGKSTTVATLVAAGWGWLADDQLVLRDGAAGPRVEGWPRPLNLDAGFAAGEVLDRRVSVPLTGRFAVPKTGEWPVGGLLLTEVTPTSASALSPASPADAFIALVRQSPWLLADPATAATITAMLTRLAERPVARLRLGRDVYARPAALTALLGDRVRGP